MCVFIIKGIMFIQFRSLDTESLNIDAEHSLVAHGGLWFQTLVN